MQFPVRKNFTRAELAAGCRQFGPQVGPLPAGCSSRVDGTQLLWALGGVESSFGANCQPRHEPAFDVGGPLATYSPMPNLLLRHGSAAACSYGPLQIMLCNAPLTYAPISFDNITLAMQASVAFLNTLLRHWKPASLAEIGECWNAGHITADPVYVSRLQEAYLVAMPEVAK